MGERPEQAVGERQRWRTLVLCMLGWMFDHYDMMLFAFVARAIGDEIELRAVKRVFGDWAYQLSMSSTKSAIGHLLGAAGAVEAIFSILAIRDQVVPPTLNLDNPSEGCDIDLVAKQAKRRKVRAALSNSFGFGGTNASLIFAGPP